MSKDPTPKADGLRAMREETRGHLQATTSLPCTTKLHSYAEGAKTRDDLAPPKKKLIPYAGRDYTEGKSRGGGRRRSTKNPKPDGPKPPRKRVKYKRKIV